MFKLASLIVEIAAETSSLDRALSRTHANLTTANVALGTFAGNVAASFARMAVGAAGGLFEATVRSASHLTESVNKANVLFGDSAKIITGHAQTMADMWSEPKQAVMDMTNKFALMGREIGYSKEQAAEFGVKVSKMALDARSLGDAETAALKIEAALAGQSKPLRSLGIFINAATVNAEAARMGLKPEESTGQLSEGSKIKARMSLIENSEFMRKAAGDLARTFKETEGQTRAFWGALSNLGTSIGEELNPAWNKLLLSFNSGLKDLKGYFEANKSTIRGWGDSVVEGFETAKVVWRNLPDVMEIAFAGADQKLEDARAKIETWATQVAVYIENAFLKAGQATGDYFQKAQGIGATVDSYLVSALQGTTSAAQTAAEATSKAFDSAVGEVAFRADVAFRPLRDLANATEKRVGAGNYKQMSVEEDIGRLKGGLGGIPKVLGAFNDYLGIVQENLGVIAEAKPKDFTSGLIDKANQHLADTLAQNTDVSSKAIAAAQARIAKNETSLLDEERYHRNEQYLTDEYAKMFPEAKKTTTGKGGGGGEGDDIFGRGGAEDVAMKKSKHEKSITDTMSFMASLQAGQLGGDVQDKQLTELQKIREADEKNAAMMEKMLLRGVGAVFG